MCIHYYQVPRAHFRIFSDIYLLSACVVLFADLSSMLLNRDFSLGEFLGGS